MGSRVVLRRYTSDDHDAMKELIRVSQSHLSGYMEWALTPPTDDSVDVFLIPAAEKFGGEDAANYAILDAQDGSYSGGCGLMPRIGPRALEIGYWVGVNQVRRGFAREAAQLLTQAAFGCQEIDRIEIHCDTSNVASALIPRRLRFPLLRQEESPIAARKHSGSSYVFAMTRAQWERETAAGIWGR